MKRSLGLLSVVCASIFVSASEGDIRDLWKETLSAYELYGKGLKNDVKQGRLWPKSMNASKIKERIFVISNLKKLSININIFA